MVSVLHVSNKLNWMVYYSHSGWGLGPAILIVLTIASAGVLLAANATGLLMAPNFTILLMAGILFALPVLGFIWWRFGGSDTLTFIIISGLFPAIMDFISSFVAHNYVYPDQSQLWVFTFIFFGWIGMCGSCLLIAEGILSRPGYDMLSQPRLWWQLPFVTSIVAVVLDLFIDPVAVKAGYWVWSVKGTVYYGIPLLNYVGWFVLMFLTPLGWILIARHRRWNYWQKVGGALIALIPLTITSAVLSLMLNSIIYAMGLK